VASEHSDRAQVDGDASGSPGEGGESTGSRIVPEQMGDVSFPVSVRGYDRRAVDAYVKRVQDAVTELETTRSPEAAVKHALEQVGEETKGILEHAGETAEHITVAAREEAEESTARAKAEADDIVAKAKAKASEILERSQAEVQATLAKSRKEAAEHLQKNRDEIAALREEAEARRRELAADTEAIRQERNGLLNDIREVATRVDEVASAAEARFPPPAGGEQATNGASERRAEGEPDTTELTETDQPTAHAASRRQSPE
jgi:DivIVA domain-containing protein